MKNMHRGAARFLLLATGVWLLPLIAYPMVMVGGGESMLDMGWPSGSLGLINLDTRFRYVEGPPYGGGEYMFEYRGGTAELNEALTLLGRIAAPELELVVHSGDGRMYAATAEDSGTVDWRFTVWVPQNFYRLYRNPNGHTMADNPDYGRELPPPRIDVYLGEDGSIDFDDVNVPVNVSVVDQRRSKGNILHGVVYDMNSGNALMGASVVLVSQDRPAMNPVSAVTDLNGRYSLENLPNGSFQIEVHATGYAPRYEGYFGGNEHEHRKTNTFLAKSTEVVGTVVNEGGVPIQGVEISAMTPVGLNGRGYPLPRSDTRRHATSGPDGRFSIAGLPEGYVHLRCGGDWYADTVYTLYPTGDSDIRVVVQRRGTIRITLLHESGAPFNGKASIELNPVPGVSSYGGGNTGAFTNGVWDWPQVPPGEYDINVPIPGVFSEDNPSRQRLTVKADGMATVILRCPKAAEPN